MDSEEKNTESRFVSVGGMKLVYNPTFAESESQKKHPCPDCHFCQFCSDARCHSCRSKSARGPCGKLSLREQIHLFERINAKK